jgi:hypothetical protein
VLGVKEGVGGDWLFTMLMTMILGLMMSSRRMTPAEAKLR